MNSLYEPLALGDLQLKNRVFMAPLTRNRAQPDGVPGMWTATYYSQRASAGLIVSEATQISAMGTGYVNTPGIYTAEHIAGWRQVTQAVHDAGGRIFLQLWHVGRISHTSLLPDNASPLAPSAITAKSQTVVATGFVDVSEPRAMTLADIRQTVEEYRQAAVNAKEAGFDGVEIHAANGYLIDQFLQSKSNVRTDDYGGAASNRVRFLREVVEAVLGVWEPSRVGVRISPGGTFNDMADANPTETFSHVVDVLNALRVGYLHVVEASPGQVPASEGLPELFGHMRAMWNGIYIVNGGYDAARGELAVSSDRADAVAYGRLFLANPDLPKRLRHGGPLNEADPSSFYGGTERGYIDYPTWGADV
ncbi:alkene reductase [Duganella vulcania]|uniref:Alkene reductase n=1 Tax=Duganella vulcania TaxID=2692166 RepID=A0A845GLR8_9BURK|nr:alkene reductase [Duganella vulcania]MYM94921.1 alkene reductase [Duganella vulcania]